MSTDTTVSREWAKRPSDQRYLSLDSLYDYTKGRADATKTFNMANRTLKAFGTDSSSEDLGELVVMTNDGPKVFSNWSFGQTAQLAGAPAGYLRKLPAPLAAACLNDGFPKFDREDSMLQTNGDDSLRCITSTTYGRIYDYDVVNKVQDVTAGTAWKIPSASYAQRDPKKATTLYASDRDVFMFLVNEENPISFNGENLFKGFYIGNSEVGASTLTMSAFFYNHVCDNRIIWGIQNQSTFKIKHSSGAPERFLQEGRKMLLEYSNESSAPFIEKIQRAKNIEVGNSEEEVRNFLKKRGLSIATANAAITAAKIEEDEYRNAWSVVQGITAHARSIKHTDTRVALETQAGNILNFVTN